MPIKKRDNDFAKDLKQLLLRGDGTKEKIAARMKCSTRTIERWAYNLTSPTYSESIRVKRIIADYLNA